jgi:hypothetical protein
MAKQEAKLDMLAIVEVYKKVGISPQEVKNGVRRRAVNHLRSVIAYRGRTELGLSSAEMASHLGVAASSISRLIEKLGAV